jgi:hypothetical protein
MKGTGEYLFKSRSKWEKHVIENGIYLNVRTSNGENGVGE